MQYISLNYFLLFIFKGIVVKDNNPNRARIFLAQIYTFLIYILINIVFANKYAIKFDINLIIFFIKLKRLIK